MERTLEEKKQLVKDLRPIDDVCFEVLASNKDNEMEKIKMTEGGLNTVCNAWKKYMDEARAEGEAKAKAQYESLLAEKLSAAEAEKNEELAALSADKDAKLADAAAEIALLKAQLAAQRA